MDQITSALIGIALVLSAVFVPMAFFGGSTGVIYRQFSITIVSAMLLSVVVALILTPALTATLLRPTDQVRDRGFFGWFNRLFARSVAALRPGCGGHPETAPAVPGGLCPAGGRSGSALRAHADRLPAGRGPGHPHHLSHAALRCDPRAHAGGLTAGRASLPGQRGRGGPGADHRRRFQLRRTRTEHGDRLCASEGLGAIASARTCGSRRSPGGP